MTIEPIAYFRSPFTSKFGIPRQSGLVESLPGSIVFTAEHSVPEALRGLDGFDRIWIIWGFSENVAAKKHPTVRPPRLGGNRQMGVFATRSPFRPNNLGLSSVKIVGIEREKDRMVINVLGADLMDGTPVYDIKPYIPQADCHPDARGGFTDTERWNRLEVDMSGVPDGMFTATELEALRETLALDPRPHYHDDPQRVYGMPFAGRDVRFTVGGGQLRVVEVAGVSGRT